MSALDHAFQSRVDLFLPYANLTVAARRQVWENFINRAGRDKFTVSDGDLIKSAHLLSLKGTEKIGMDRLTMLAQNRMKALSALADQ